MSRRLDITRAGNREYTEAQEQTVLGFALVHMRDEYLTVADIAQKLGVEGRTVRAILSWHDGRSFKLAGGDEGLKLAAYEEEAEALTERIHATGQSNLDRATRRRLFTLPRRQELLF